MPKDEIVEEAIVPLDIEVTDDPAPVVDPALVEEEVIEEPIEEEVVPVEEPKQPSVDYQALYEKQRQTNDDLQKQIYTNNVPTEPELQPEQTVAIPDPYQDPDGFARYLADRDKKTAENAVQTVMASPEMQNLQMTVGMREHEIQKTETKEELGDYIDMENDQEAIQDVQRRYVGMPMNEAARIVASQRIIKQNNQLKEGVVERKKAQVPPTGGATRTVQTKVETAEETAVLTSTQEAYANKYYGNHKDVQSGKITAVEKYQKGIANMENGGYLE